MQALWAPKQNVGVYGWGGVDSTLETVMTTRAPAVLEIVNDLKEVDLLALPGALPQHVH